MAPLKYSHFFLKAPTGGLFLSSSLQVLETNPPLLKIFGQNENEKLNDNFCNLIISQVQKIISQDAPNCGVLKITDVHGSLKVPDYQFHADLESDLNLMLFHDVTEQTSTKSNLTEIYLRNKLLFETMVQGVVYQDKNGTITTMNPAAERILGKEKEEFLGSSSVREEKDTIKEDGTPFPGEEHPSMLALKTGKIQQGVVMGVFNPKRNQYRWITISAVPLFKDAEREPYQVCTLFDDITESRKYQEEIINAKVMMEAAKNKMAFLDIAAHELRNPISAITLGLDVIEQETQSGLPVDPSIITLVKSPAERLSMLVNDLLDISRLERGLMDLKYQSFSLNNLISSCIDEVKIQFPHREIIFNNPLEPIEIEADKTRIGQVICNLLDNATKYTPADEKIEVTTQVKEVAISVSVKDYGPGIAQDQQQLIFSPFSRGKLDPNISRQGLGLGLSVCSGIIKLHGGIIGVITQPGEGSNFYFEIPRKRPNVS